jgi:hypothetical protein
VRDGRDGAAGDPSNVDRDGQKLGANIATSVGERWKQKSGGEDKMMRRRKPQGIVGTSERAPHNNPDRDMPALKFEGNRR